MRFRCTGMHINMIQNTFLQNICIHIQSHKHVYIQMQKMRNIYMNMCTMYTRKQSHEQSFSTLFTRRAVNMNIGAKILQIFLQWKLLVFECRNVIAEMLSTTHC